MEIDSLLNNKDKLLLDIKEIDDVVRSRIKVLENEIVRLTNIKKKLEDEISYLVYEINVWTEYEERIVTYIKGENDSSNSS